MFYVYILKLANSQHYVGYTSNLNDRLTRHACGTACTTTERVRVESVAFYAAFTSEKLARNFEKYLKSSSGFAFRNKRLTDAS